MVQPIDPAIGPFNSLKVQGLSKELVVEASERVNAGERVDNGSANAAGNAAVERMNSKIRDANATMRNAYEGIYVSETIDGSLQQVSDQLHHMKQAAEQSAPAKTTTASVSDFEESMTALATIDGMIEHIAVAQAHLDSVQTDLEGTISGAQQFLSTQSAPTARIIDAEYAEEAAKKISALIQQQGNDAIAVQANLFPKNVLQLII